MHCLIFIQADSTRAPPIERLVYYKFSVSKLGGVTIAALPPWNRDCMKFAGHQLIDVI